MIMIIIIIKLLVIDRRAARYRLVHHRLPGRIVLVVVVVVVVVVIMTMIITMTMIMIMIIVIMMK